MSSAAVCTPAGRLALGDSDEEATTCLRDEHRGRHKLSEQEKTDRHRRRWEEVAEIVEVLFLAIAAIATAWSGYRAAKGEGHQSVLCGQATSAQFGAAATLGASSWPRTRPCSTAGCRPGRPTTPNSSRSSFAGSP